MISESSTGTVGEFTDLINHTRQTVHIKLAGSILDLTKPAFLAILLVAKCQLPSRLRYKKNFPSSQTSAFIIKLHYQFLWYTVAYFVTSS